MNFSVPAGAVFLILLNAGLAAAGLYLLRRPAARPAGWALLAGACLSTVILGVLVTRLSELLFGTRLIDIGLYAAFEARPYLFYHALLLALLLAGIAAARRRFGAAVFLIGLCAAAAYWFGADLLEQPPVALFPLFAAALIALLTVPAVERTRWLAAAPLALSALVLARVLLAAGRFPAEPALPQAPPGFALDVFAEISAPPVSLAVDDTGALYVTRMDGVVLKLLDDDRDGAPDRRIVFAEGLGQPLGIAWHKDRMYISAHTPGEIYSGRILRAEDTDGDGRADRLTDIVTGLPSGLYVFHQNNQIAIGPDERIYVGVGSSSDHDEETVDLAASILSFNLDGSGLQVHATGMRNPFGLAFAPDGSLFATDNGPDRLNDTLLYVPVDELNLIVAGGDYGFPRHFGDVPPAAASHSPVKSFVAQTVPTGLAVYDGTLFPAEYRGSVFVALARQGPALRGGSHRGLRVARVWQDPAAGRWHDEDFVTGLAAPIDVEEGASGELYISDMNTMHVYRVTYPEP